MPILVGSWSQIHSFLASQTIRQVLTSTPQSPGGTARGAFLAPQLLVATETFGMPRSLRGAFR